MRGTSRETNHRLALNPARVLIGGELTADRDLIVAPVRTPLAERSLTEHAVQTPLEVTPAVEHPRLRGAIALMTARRPAGRLIYS